jgi:hypothetical protein
LANNKAANVFLKIVSVTRDQLLTVKILGDKGAEKMLYLIPQRGFNISVKGK